MGWFSGLKAAVKSGAKEINREYGKTDHFLKAVCASVALVIWADGEVEDSEKKQGMQVLTEHEQLSKIYPRSAIENEFNAAMAMGSSNSGKNRLGTRLDEVRSLPDGASMADDVYLMATDVAASNSRHEIGEKEQKVLTTIAKHLSVDPSKFEF